MTSNCSDAHQLFPQFQIEARFVKYVNTALWRQAKDYHKKRYSQKQFIDIEDVETISDGQDVIRHLTNRNLFASLENRALYTAVQGLTPRQQYILYAYAVQRFTFQEIADQLNVSQQTISKTYQRVIMKLRQTLKGED
ncbi:sigma-70 family RNA polymerase sigma factor [Halobacillus andaensis]|uniref:sigma-70 family RNA polymerase sigma factor n=1 Tax=Halobacillus andaensis TaxID=1176239 RepID=UPI003D75174E